MQMAIGRRKLISRFFSIPQLQGPLHTFFFFKPCHAITVNMALGSCLLQSMPYEN
jgi:hypothetical protein